MVRVGINGFGRMGKVFLRVALKSDLEIVAVNSLTDARATAHLLKYDSVHGRFDGDVRVRGSDEIEVNGAAIKVLSEREPEKLPWRELGVDVVIEATGAFRSGEEAASAEEVNAAFDAYARSTLKGILAVEKEEKG